MASSCKALVCSQIPANSVPAGAINGILGLFIVALASFHQFVGCIASQRVCAWVGLIQPGGIPSVINHALSATPKERAGRGNAIGARWLPSILSAPLDVIHPFQNTLTGLLNVTRRQFVPIAGVTEEQSIATSGIITLSFTMPPVFAKTGASGRRHW